MSTAKTEYQLHGFMIGKEIHFDIDNRRLYRLPSGSSEKHIVFGSIFFNDTMLQLFLYLLQYGRDHAVSKEELLMNIWKKNDLSPSAQRLWQVMKNLTQKLNLLGLPDDFILNTKGRGYKINYSNVIPIYYKTSELLNCLEKDSARVEIQSE
jgi:DNA-binding winged helix-turn-helix (wHTH) protein